MNLERLPSWRALDVVYALLLDDMDGPRGQARAALNEALLRPLDAGEAEVWERERWGVNPAHAREALAGDALFDQFTVGE